MSRNDRVLYQVWNMFRVRVPHPMQWQTNQHPTPAQKNKATTETPQEFKNKTNFPNQDNSVHACKLFLTWMISVICCAPVGSCVSLGADVLWCTGGNEVLCKGLGTSLSGIAIRSLPFVQLQLWGLAPWCMPSSKAGLFPAFQWKYLGYTRKTNKKTTTKATHQPKQKINKPTLFFPASLRFTPLHAAIE